MRKVFVLMVMMFVTLLSITKIAVVKSVDTSPSELLVGEKVLVDIGGTYGSNSDGIVQAVVVTTGSSPRLVVIDNLGETSLFNDAENENYYTCEYLYDTCLVNVGAGSILKNAVDAIASDAAYYIESMEAPYAAEINNLSSSDKLLISDGSSVWTQTQYNYNLDADIPTRQIYVITDAGFVEVHTNTSHGVKPAFSLSSSITLVDSNDDSVYEIFNNAPEFTTTISNITINNGETSSNTQFSVSDDETDNVDLNVTGESSDTGVVANNDISLTQLPYNASTNPNNEKWEVNVTASAVGTTTITLTVTDDDTIPKSDTLTFDVTVYANPTISSISNQTTPYETSLDNVPFTISDTESIPENLILSGESDNQTLVSDGNIVFGGTVATGNRAVSISPNSGVSGQATITITVEDEHGGTAIEEFTLTVNAPNGSPTISSVDNQTVAEDGIIEDIHVVVNDAETSDESLVVTAISDDQSLIPNGNIDITIDGSDRYIDIEPLADQNGVCTITLTVSDGENTATETFDVTVTAENDAPTISTIANQNIAEDTSVSDLAFTIGDLETDSDSLVLTKDSSNPSLVPLSNIVITGTGDNRLLNITPLENQFGTTNITITVDDGEETDYTTFSVIVSPVNDLPTITEIDDVNVIEDEEITGVEFTYGDVDTTSGLLVISAVSSNKALIPDENIVFTGSGFTKNIGITQTPNMSGQSTITVSIYDQVGTTTEQFIVTIQSENDNPTITEIDDQVTNMNEDINHIEFLADDAETSSGLLIVTSFSSDQTIIHNNDITFATSGIFRTINISPTLDKYGIVTITITVEDGAGGSSQESFDLSVIQTNGDPRIEQIDDVTINEDGSTTIYLSIRDDESSAENLILESIHTNSGLIPIPNAVLGGTAEIRTLTVTPVPNGFGTSTFTLTVTDEGGASSTMSFDFIVQSINDLPTVSSVADQTLAEDGEILGIPILVGDVETTSGFLVLSASSSNETLFPDGSITFGGSDDDRLINLIPADDQYGEAVITITVTDEDDGETDVHFNVLVTPVNDTPTISSIDDFSTPEDEDPLIVVTIDDLETAPDDLIFSVETSSGIIPIDTIMINGTGNERDVEFRLFSNQFGTAGITITVEDEGGLVATETFTLTVESVNDEPTITEIDDKTILEDTTDYVSFTIGDVETDTGSLIVSATSNNQDLITDGSLILSRDGDEVDLFINPLANQYGTAEITVSVSDGEDTTIEIFEVNVTSQNDLPEIDPLVSSVAPEDTAVVYDITYSDIETTSGLLVLEIESSNQALIPDGNITINGTSGDRSVTFLPLSNQYGTTTITVTVTDADLGETVETFDIEIVSVNDAPFIVSIPGEDVYTEDALEWSPTETTASDIEDNDVTDSIEYRYYLESAPGVEISLNNARIGLYEGNNVIVEYTAYDSELATDSFTCLYTSIDNTDPSFDVIEDQEIVIDSANVNWTTYINNKDDNVSSIFTVFEMEDNVLYDTEGTYSVRVKLVDEAGNFFERTFNVRVYPTDLEITFVSNGEFLSSGMVEYNQPVHSGLIPIPSRNGYNFVGWSYDSTAYDSELTGFTMPTVDVVMTARFTVKDYSSSTTTGSSSNSSWSLDTTLLGDKKITLELGEEFIDPGYEIMFGSMDLSDEVTVTTNLDVNEVGEYTISYRYSGMYGGATLYRTVTIADLTAPTIELLGNSHIYLYVGEVYSDPGFTVTDNYDMTVTGEKDGTVDSSTTGTYTIHYIAQDIYGNSTEIMRSVTVKPIPAGIATITVNDVEYSINLISKLLDEDYSIEYAVSDKDYRLLSSNEWFDYTAGIELDVYEPNMRVHIRIKSDDHQDVFTSEKLPYVDTYIKITEDEVTVESDDSKEDAIEENQTFKKDIVKFQKEIVEEDEVIIVVFDLRERDDVKELKVYYREKVDATDSLMVYVSAADNWTLLVIDEGQIDTVTVPSNTEYEFVTELTLKEGVEKTQEEFVVLNEGGEIVINLPTEEVIVEPSNNYFLWLLPSIIFIFVLGIYEIFAVKRDREDENQLKSP